MLESVTDTQSMQYVTFKNIELFRVHENTKKAAVNAEVEELTVERDE